MKENVVYELSVSDISNVTADDITVRILNPYKKAKLYVFDGNSWVELEYNTKGSYVETTMHGTQAQFCFVNEAVDPMLYIMIGAGAFAVIALVVMIKLIHVCRKKRKSMSDKKEEEKLNKGFEELIKWDKMVAKSQKQNAENKQKFQNTKLDESFDAFDINQACDYIQDSYLEFRSLYLEQYERTGGNIDIKSLFSSVLRSGNQDMHKYCEFLFEKIGFIV